MKKILVVFVSLFCMVSVHAQKKPQLAINLYGGYVFQDKLQFDGFTGYVEGGFQYGGGLEYFIQKSISLELKYLRQETSIPLNTFAGLQVNKGRDKATVSYILLGATSYFGASSQSKIMPFGGLGAGVGIVDAKSGGSTTKFAWDGKLGIQLKTSSQVSFKLQATFQSITAGVGSDQYVASGGYIIAVPDYVTLFQFGLGGALCYTF